MMKAFTLSELLIALAIIGLISSFAIRKVFFSIEEQNKKAIMKESIATLSQIAYEGALTGQLTCDSIESYFAERLNYLRRCTGDPSVQGCFPADSDSSRRTQGDAYVLHNGAMLSSLNSSACTGFNEFTNGVVIDWNGESGPNRLGEDEIHVLILYGEDPRAGTVIADVGSETHFNSLFE